MKKRIFKFGAALTAALMMFSATASLAFADEVDVDEAETVVEATVDEAAADEVEAVEPEEDAEVVEDAEDVEDTEDAEAVEVVVPLETEAVDADEIDEVAVAAAEDVATGSEIAIGEISATVGDSYYTVSVPFTVTEVPDQMTFFVYDITAIANGNNETAFSSTTPVGYINQYAGEGAGTYSFKLSKDNYNSDSIIVVKIGGTDVATPDAKSFSLSSADDGGDVVYGDANGDGTANNLDAILVMQYAMKIVSDADLDLVASDVNLDNSVNNKDAILIMQYAMKMIDGLPYTD